MRRRSFRKLFAPAEDHRGRRADRRFRPGSETGGSSEPVRLEKLEGRVLLSTNLTVNLENHAASNYTTWNLDNHASGIHDDPFFFDATG